MYRYRTRSYQRQPWYVNVFGPPLMFLAAFLLGNVLLYLAIWIMSVQ